MIEAGGTVRYTSEKAKYSSASTQTLASVLSLHELAEVSRIFAKGGTPFFGSLGLAFLRQSQTSIELFGPATPLHL